MTRTLVVSLLTLGDPGRLTGGYLFHQRLSELAPAHGARIDFVSLPERPFPLAALDAPAALRQARADVLVLDSIAAAFLGPWLLANRPPAPLIGMLHQPLGGIDHGPVRTRVQAVLDRLAYRRAERLLVASDSLADALVAGGMARARLRVVPPGRDVAEPDAPPRDLRHGRNAAFLCVANWLERKGILELLDVFSRLPPEAATLHLAGDDRADSTYAERVRARLREPDLAPRVVVHGPISRGAVASLYRDADAFVLPSVREPYGTVYGEAMAFGLPVVGWTVGNLPYLATHEREGLLVPVGDREGLRTCLLRLASDPDLARQLGEAARLRAAQRPTWHETAALFFGAIREVLQGGQPRSDGSAVAGERLT